MKSYSKFWTRTFDYKGVASRTEYWIPMIINLIMPFPIALLLYYLGFNVEHVSSIAILYWPVTILPSISLTIRRLHDHNFSGLFILFVFFPGAGTFILLIFTLLGTVKEFNRWRLYDIQRGYIIEEPIKDIFDEPLSDNQWTHKDC